MASSWPAESSVYSSGVRPQEVCPDGLHLIVPFPTLGASQPAAGPRGPLQVPSLPFRCFGVSDSTIAHLIRQNHTGVYNVDSVKRGKI